jgi:HK97 family phage major capsid protein
LPEEIPPQQGKDFPEQIHSAFRAHARLESEREMPLESRSPLSARQIIDQAFQILDNKNNRNLDRAAQGKVDCLLRMAALVQADDYAGRDRFGRAAGLQTIASEVLRHQAEQTIDDATLRFFRGQRFQDPVISTGGGRIVKLENVVCGGRSVGAVTELRDFSALLPESRTYAGLTTATGGVDGGNIVPTGFIPTVFQAMKRTDQILEAANWDIAATVDGRKTNMPSLSDTSTSAVTVAEAGAMSFANPTFGQIAWPEATTWTSQVIKASVQLDLDAGVQLAALLADAFRVRFARGFGASVVSTVLGDAPSGATSASPTAVTQGDLLSLMNAVDEAYAAADTAGFVMNWNSFLSIVKNNLSIGVGDALYLLHKDAKGHYLLYEKPVFISPSMPDIAAGATPILFGDWNRLIIRNVPTEALVRRYDELYMQNMQVGYEMLFRGDAEIMHAGGSGDDPIKVLTCHS